MQENEVNLASQKQNRCLRNFEFVQQNSQQNRDASEFVYRVTYINK